MMKMNKTLLLIVLILFSSCYTQKKAKKDIYKIKGNYPKLLDKYCADEFRSDRKDSIIKGDTVTITDTLFDSDTFFVDCPPNALKVVKVPCPPSKTIKEYSLRVDTLYREFPESLAKIKHLTNENEELKKENANLNKEVATLKKKLFKAGAVIGSMILLIAISLILKFKKI